MVNMSIALLPVILFVVAADHQLPPSATQLPDFKKNTDGPIGILTTAAGAPVDYSDTILLNSNFINSEYFMDQIQSTVREKIPERVVHAPGVGAFGYFEVTHDISRYCKAKMFSKVGKKTPVAVRLSVTGSRIGAPDTSQGSRGFAVKFYTEEGNFDLCGLSIPLSSIKEPERCAALLRVRRENPATNLPDPNMMWDFVTQNPEAIFANLYTLSDYGAPASYSHMTCYSVHTYQVYNKQGISSFIKFHLIPCGGAKFLNGTEARKIAAGDPNYYAKDFYNSIANGKYPCYYLKAQILSEEDRKNAVMDIFDVTKLLDEHRYPLIKIGRIIVNKNMQNHFAEIETLAFSPGNYVPGMLGCPDKLFQARCFLYRDAQMYRLGSNYNNVPVNCPIQSQVLNYIRDGVPPFNINIINGPNYRPNSFNGPIPCKDKNRPKLLKIHEQPANNFKQAGYFYSKVLTPAQRTTLINNIIKEMCPCVETIKNRAIKYFRIIHSDLGKRVAKGLAVHCTHDPEC